MKSLSKGTMRFHLVQLTENSFFGDQEILLDEQVRTTQAVVTSVEAEIFVINKQVGRTDKCRSLTLLR